MSLDAASNAIVTVDDFLRFAGYGEGEHNLDTDRLQEFINMASQLIEDYCHRAIVSPDEQIEETFDGDGTKEYFVDQCRIADPDSIVLYYWSGTAFAEMTASLYPRSVQGSKGRVFLNDGKTFGDGADNYQIKYTPGWAQASVPEPFRTVCCSVVARLLKLHDKDKGKEGLTSESFGDSSTSYDLPTLMKTDHKRILDRYRKVSLG